MSYVPNIESSYKRCSYILWFPLMLTSGATLRIPKPKGVEFENNCCEQCAVWGQDARESSLGKGERKKLSRWPVAGPHTKIKENERADVE